MNLNSDQIEAFLAIVREKTFSKAARSLHLTQPSLTKRIQLLEEQLSTSLLDRHSKGAKLTEAGQILYRYCRQRKAYDDEFLFQFLGSEKKLGGTIRIAGKSSITHLLIIPSLSGLFRKNSNLHLEITSTITDQIPELVTRGEVDFGFSHQPLNRQGMENHLLGSEDYIVVESGKGCPRRWTFLDASPDDTTTQWYFSQQSSKQIQPYRRSFFQNDDGILRAVANGLGRAVIEERVIPKNLGLVRSKEFKKARNSIYLIYRKQSFYSLAQKAVIKEILTAVPEKLRHLPS